MRCETFLRRFQRRLTEVTCHHFSRQSGFYLSFSEMPTYSYRSATMGSTLAALRAGI